MEEAVTWSQFFRVVGTKTISNKKASQDDHIDRICYLPCNVIDDIVAHLDIKDLVRTNILSKRWRYMWTYVPLPQLWFDEYFFDQYEDLDDPVAYKIITDVLMQHKGPIDKFGLFISDDYKFEITIEHLDTWIPILSKRNIKHLELVNYATHLDQMPYIVLSCKQLTYFKFFGFDLSIPPDFCGFKILLELHLLFVRFQPGALESLISNCPLLKNLHIVLCKDFEYFDFAPPTLEDLLIEFDQNMKSICLKKANNLIDLTLIATNGCVFALIKSLPKKIQRLSIGPRIGFYKVQYANIIPPTLLKSSFNSIKYLKLGGVDFNDRGELLYIVSALQCALGLVELVIQSYIDVCNVQVSDHSEELECSSYCLNNLHMVNIHVRAHRISRHAMSLIRFILANSTSLRTLTFKVGPTSKKFTRISQDLLRMERASQRAHVEFLVG